MGKKQIVSPAALFSIGFLEANLHQYRRLSEEAEHATAL